jgi:hypothetical protein
MKPIENPGAPLVNQLAPIFLCRIFLFHIQLHKPKIQTYLNPTEIF